ncbi:MAG: hypothetical protein ABIH03_13345, partial [Pseudomonadota bacterium]
QQNRAKDVTHASPRFLSFCPSSQGLGQSAVLALFALLHFLENADHGHNVATHRRLICALEQVLKHDRAERSGRSDLPVLAQEFTTPRLLFRKLVFQCRHVILSAFDSHWKHLAVCDGRDLPSALLSKRSELRFVGRDHAY